MLIWLRACIIRRLSHAQITCACSIHCTINMHTYCPQIRSQWLASSLLHWIDIDKAGKLIAHISACSQKQQNNTHHLLWNLWRSISFMLYKHAPGNTHTCTYSYIYIYSLRKNSTCISVWVHALTSLVAHILVCDAFTCGQVWTPSSGTSDALVKSVLYHGKKPLSFHPEFRPALL